jgi:MSHA biogenesis protein MshE
VNAKIGLDFARVLRTTLRQDPDIILVGEMRDKETAEIGLRAAITGHLVLSTLHTMSAAATIHRLLDMGAPGYMIAAAVHGIVAQRLLRRLCENCARPAQPTAQEAALLQGYFGAQAARGQFMSGTGCTYCNLTGYRGRTAIYELLDIDRTLSDAIRRGDLHGLEAQARAQAGFVPLAQSALELAMRGGTSLSEALAVTSGGMLESPPDSLTAPTDPLVEDALAEDALTVESVR